MKADQLSRKRNEGVLRSQQFRLLIYKGKKLDSPSEQQEGSAGEGQTEDKNFNQSPGQVDLVTLEKRNDYLRELSAALVRLNKGKRWLRRLFEEKAESVYGWPMIEEKIVDTIGKELSDLLSDVKKVITAHRKLLQQVKNLQLQLGKAQADNLGLRDELQSAENGLRATEAELSRSRDSGKELWTQLQKEQAKLADEQKSLSESRRENKRLQDGLSTLRNELSQAEAKIDRRERELAEEQKRTQIERQKLEKSQREMEVIVEKNNQQLEKSQREMEVFVEKNNQLVQAVRRRTAELEGEVNRLLPGAHDEQIIFSFYEYHNRLSAAARENKINGALPRREISVGRDGIGDLFYSYNPSRVASAIDSLNRFLEKAREKKEELGKDRVLDKNMLLGFAGVLGYSNLYTYLIQLLREKPDHKDSHFLQVLCDLSVPSWQVEALVTDLDVVAWLAKHMPPKEDVSNSPCSFSYSPTVKSSIVSYGSGRNYKKDVKDGHANFWEDYDDEMRKKIAVVIVDLEKQSLLDFRESLFVTISAIAPLTPEDFSLPEEPPIPEEAALADPLPRSSSRQTLETPGHQFRLLGYTFEPDLSQGVHIIQFEYRGPNINIPVEAEIAFNNAGEILPETKEDE